MPSDSALARVLIVTTACAIVISAENDVPRRRDVQCPDTCSCLESYVDCSHKKFSTLPPVPRWTKQLDLAGNEITSLLEGSLDDLSELVVLKLNNNTIENIPSEVFKHLGNLKTLNLNKNNIKTLRYNVFQGLSMLRILRLNHNNIENITTGAFYGFKSLDLIKLDHNKITSISKGSMFGLESLTKMFLSHNNIFKIDSDCWERSINLEELDLSHNKITSLDGRTFKHLKKLKVLALSENLITSISQDAFGHTQMLRKLQLDNNRISWTVEDMAGPFSKLHNLQTFDLSMNHIKSINSKAFEGLSKLKDLDLRGNNITSIHRHAFETLKKIKIVHLNGSTLLCDCNLQWISKWIRSNVDPQFTNATCAYPAKLRGRPIYELNNTNCGDSPQPKVVEHPKAQKAIYGYAMHFLCAAVSNPFSNMTFLWRKNNVNISKPTLVEKVSTNDQGQKIATSELIIPNVTQADNGKYQCLVSNGFGTTYSHRAEIKMVTFPEFTKKPANVTVRTGQTVSLSCAASGDPSPEISWKKDGGNDFPAARERRMRVMPNDPVFFIVSVKTDDMGVYSCTAKNSGGTIISNATVSVLEPPSVSRHIERKEVTTGEEVVIQCMVSGSPKPQLKWLKDGEPIVATERHFFTAEDQLLIIVKTERSDAGQYECEITNYLGNDKGVTELSVISAAEDMTGIIIITVVCCAVGTSIIWVVIIYHTRRRMARAVPSFQQQESINMTNVQLDSDVGAQVFSDNVSERSSCKDSGTGDSAKQGSFDDASADRGEIHFDSGVATRFSPPAEAHRLLPSSFKPSIQPSYGGQPNYYGGPPAGGPPLETGHGPYPSLGAVGTVSPQVQQWFRAVDKDQSGYISANELKSALVNAQGQQFSETACRLMIGMFDKDHSGHMNIEEFDKLYTYVNQWLSVFKTYDTDQSGLIEQEELSKAFSQMGFRFSPTFIEFLMKRSNGGKVSVDSFIVLCVQIQRFTEAFRVRDAQQQGTISIAFEDFLNVALSCSI